MKFSIITPSFQSSKWLKLCIASVADQKDVTFEHIIQDSCSDDGTQDWLPNVPGVAAFIERDIGMYDAVNRGLRRASGEICAYLNCDEQYLPGTLSQIRAFFDARPEVDVVFGDAILIDAEGLPLSYRRTILPSLSHLRLADLNTLTCATFFRRRLVEAGHLFPTHLKIAGDQYWIFQLLQAGVRMEVLRKPLSVFTFTGSNLSNSARASEEKFIWLPSNEKPIRWLTPPVVLWHRLRKLFAGAYRRRCVTIEIYTQDHSQRRRQISSSVGFRWPKPPI